MDGRVECMDACVWMEELSAWMRVCGWDEEMTAWVGVWMGGGDDEASYRSSTPVWHKARS